MVSDSYEHSAFFESLVLSPALSASCRSTSQLFKPTVPYSHVYISGCVDEASVVSEQSRRSRTISVKFDLNDVGAKAQPSAIEATLLRLDSAQAFYAVEI